MRTRRLGLGRRWWLAGVALVLTLAGACSPGPTMARTDRAVRLPASPTELPALTPAQFRALLQRLRGIPVVVNVWASWCGPCAVEAPHLARAARQYRGRVQFLGVDVKDQRGPARAFIRRYGWIYPSVFDPDLAIRNALGFLGQPDTVIFDRAGRRVFVWSGPVPPTVLERQIERVLSGQT